MSEDMELRGPLLPKRGADFEVFFRTAPPWEIGQPQRAFRDLADRGAFRGRVLDVGCGSDEHALLAASQGLEATGVDALAAVTASGGRYFMPCFSEHAPGSGGPRRVTEAEIRSTFVSGWRVDAVTRADIVTTGIAVPAWLATMTRE